MKYASERGMDTSVHSWKPCPTDRFTRLVHGYATTCCSDHGHAGLSMTACKLDHDTTATVYYRPKQFPEHCGISTPVLMTIETADGRVISFERIPSIDYPGLPEVTGQPAPDRNEVLARRDARRT